MKLMEGCGKLVPNRKRELSTISTSLIIVK